MSATCRQTTLLADVRAEGTFGKDTRLVLHASYNRSAGFAAADGYWSASSESQSLSVLSAISG